MRWAPSATAPGRREVAELVDDARGWVARVNICDCIHLADRATDVPRDRPSPSPTHTEWLSLRRESATWMEFARGPS